MLRILLLFRILLIPLILLKLRVLRILRILLILFILHACTVLLILLKPALSRRAVAPWVERAARRVAVERDLDGRCLGVGWYAGGEHSVSARTPVRRTCRWGGE